VKARLRKLLSLLSETFWLMPALMILIGVAAAFWLIDLDRNNILPASILAGPWLYNGGGTGARTLLGAIVASTIGVAGTVFSITIAALSLTAGQMGPRLLRNFTRDRGNQFTLGAFLGTFSYALIVLRSVRTQSEGEFVPHLSLAVAIALAFLCVGTLVFFVEHMASRINVDTVIELVSEDLTAALRRLTSASRQHSPPAAAFWREASHVIDTRRGYMQHLDHEGLADWAAANSTAIRLLVRPGDYVFPGAPIAVVSPPVKGAGEAIHDATALGAQRVGAEDLEFGVRQLVEVAVRALSPGINDPHTAMSVLDRLGAALCETATVYLPTGVMIRGGRPALIVPSVDYDGLVDAMFHMVRQNAYGSIAVMIRMLEVLTAVVACERDLERVNSLQRHADLVMHDAQRGDPAPADFEDLRIRYGRFAAVRVWGPMGHVVELQTASVKGSGFSEL
jgi:uncharacterized membrane protein